MPTHHMPFAAHNIAGVKISDHCAHFDDLADKFVSHYHRYRDGALCPSIPFVNVQICAANAGAQHFDQDFIDGDFWHGHFV